MAAVSSWPAHVAPASRAPGPSYNNAANNREIRPPNVPPLSRNDDGENSDAYSLEARSDASETGDTAAAVDSAGGEAVRPDSLTLTSPLEQLTRSLSLNKKDDTHQPSTNSTSRSRNRRGQQDNNDAGIPPVEQVLLEYLAAAESKHEQGASKSSESNNQSAATYPFPSTHDLNSKDQRNEPDNIAFEPVRFSDDTTRTGGTEDVSDGQSQLINAFRSSYHTYMTRSGGLRDSSYSWMAPDADSPNMTMDFKQAEAVFNAANHKGEGTDQGRYDDQEGDDVAHGQDNDNSADWTLGDKAKVRVSSWDSQAAKKMELHRIPSQKSSKTPTDGRTSDVSAFEPFHYSNYESALKAHNDSRQREQTRASNWTNLTDYTQPDDPAAQVRPLSTIEEGLQTPSVYAYAVDSPSVLQDSFAGPSRVTSAAPAPLRAKIQAGRTNFSRPQNTLTTRGDQDYHESQQDIEQLEHFDRSQLPYATSNQGSPHLSSQQGSPAQARNPYDSVYSAYTQTSDFDTPRAVPQAPFQGGAARPQYSPSSSSHTTYTVHDANASQRPDLQTLESYQRAYEQSLDGQQSQPVPNNASTTKKHRRTPSQVLSSAINKHRAQRAAAGLTTEGQYYVDPKTKKYYFVADSGQPGGSAILAMKNKDGKENEKPKERRKLHKKEAGWEVTKVSQPKPASPPQTPQTYERDRSLSLSARSKGSSKGSEDGHGSGSKWKIWSSGRSHGSRDNTPQASPLQPSPMGRDQSRQPHYGFPEQNSLELLAHAEAVTGYGPAGSQSRHAYPHASPSIVQVAPPDQTQRSPSSSSEVHRQNQGYEYSSRGPPSSQGHSSHSHTPHLQPPPNFGYPPSDAAAGHGMERSNSVYSNYSYYEMSSDQGYMSSARASPIMDRSGSAARNMGQSPNPNVPLASPYMAPTAPEFQPSSGPAQPSAGSHSRQPSTTLDKAKNSMQRTGSMQLLATTKHQNLTVPKGEAGRGVDLEELARLNPNDPLVCLHRGIDAHERGDLEESAQLFEQSAQGGCGLGMLMFGLSLRHGWGCESQPERGFKYLQQAAESVVQNLDRVISGHVQLSEQQLEEQSAKSELVLSIYELGQCFLRGWGVSKDKKTALQYFTLAANLGDPDAQSELGFCYSTGRGCKKDLKKAAKYYRMAAKQGQMTYGMQWIFKSKYDD